MPIVKLDGFIVRRSTGPARLLLSVPHTTISGHHCTIEDLKGCQKDQGENELNPVFMVVL